MCGEEERNKNVNCCTSLGNVFVRLFTFKTYFICLDLIF